MLRRRFPHALIATFVTALAVATAPAEARTRNTAPVISGTPATSAFVGTAYRFVPTAYDANGDRLSFKISGKPAWATFSTATGALTGTPTTAGTTGSISIKVSDGRTTSALPSFSITVTKASVVNRAPTISGTPATSDVAGTAYQFRPSAADADGDALAFSIANKPAWASFDATTGTLSGTPSEANAGTCASIVISVSDGQATVSLPAFAIMVTTANHAPVISGTPTTSLTAGTAYSFRPTASDADGDALTFSVTNKPTWASFSASTGALTGSPTAGTYGSIVISVSDGKASASLPAFTIAVAAANRAPVISGAPATTATVGTAYAFTPTASDADGDALTFSIANKPAWASFNASNGALSGTPSAEGSTSGIVISVSDGKASASLAAFNVTVSPANQAPTISGTPATTADTGAVYSFKPAASDADGDTLGFSVQNKPSWASFDSTTGTLSGTPTSAVVNSNIVIGVTDGRASASLPAFSITVTAVNHAPTISGAPSTTATTGTAYTFKPTAADADGDALTFSVTGKPAWASFDGATGALAGTPTVAGTSSGIVISVSDGKASTSLAAFSIVASDPVVNHAPTISGTASSSAIAGTAYSFKPTAADPDGDALTFSIANKPAWAAFDSATGTLAGTPSTANAGTFSNIAISVSDGKLTAALSPFAITVTVPNHAPTISGSPATTATTGTAYSFKPTAADADGDALTFSVTGKPAWASFDSATGTLAGTPTVAGTSSGIVISVSDGKASAALAAFSIVASDPVVNHAPTISGAPATSVVAGSAYSFKPTATDVDGDTLTYSVANKPAWASFSASTGTLSGTPSTANAGTFSNIVISVSDGKATAALSPFAITVTVPNRAPTISGTPVTTAQADQPYSFKPTASDADGNTLTFSISNKPAWATFEASTGMLYGTPTAANVGTYSNIVITVSDGQLSAQLAAFSITVSPAPTKSVTLTWSVPTRNTDGSSLGDLAGFKVYYGTASGQYATTLSLPNATLSSVVIEGLTTGTWYFSIKSINTSGVESAYSGEVNAVL